MILSFYKCTVKSSVPMLAVISVALLSPMMGQQAMADDGIPDGALAYAYIDVGDMKYAEEFQLFERLLGHVSTEASMVSLQNLGLDITTLADIVIAVPPVTQTMSSEVPAACAEFTFLKSFRTREIARRLGEEWKPTEVNGNTYYVSADVCLFISSKTTLLAGSPAAVQWYAESEDNSVELTNMVEVNRGNVHIAVGVDMRQIPTELIQAFTGEVAPNFAGVEFLETTISFDEALFVNAYAHCSDDSKATQLGKDLKNVLSTGIDQLVALDEQTMDKVSDAPLTQAVESLAILAAVRESIQVMEDTEIEVTDAVTSVSMMTDSQLLLCVPLLGAVAALGQSAQESFEKTSQQLSETAPLEEQPETKNVVSPLRSGSLVPATSRK